MSSSVCSEETEFLDTSSLCSDQEVGKESICGTVYNEVLQSEGAAIYIQRKKAERVEENAACVLFRELQCTWAEQKATLLINASEKLAKDLMTIEGEKTIWLKWKLARAKEWAKEKALVAATLSFSPVVIINVGGRLFTTTMETLQRAPSTSLISKLFSGRHKLPFDAVGNIFIDRDPDHFGKIISFLRSPVTFFENFPQASLNSGLIAEAKFFDLYDKMFPEVLEQIVVPKQCYGPIRYEVSFLLVRKSDGLFRAMYCPSHHKLASACKCDLTDCNLLMCASEYCTGAFINLPNGKLGFDMEPRKVLKHQKRHEVRSVSHDEYQGEYCAVCGDNMVYT